MAMTKCPECGKEISIEAQVCPNCGKPVEQKVAPEQKEGSFLRDIDVGYAIVLLIIGLLVLMLIINILSH
jgi:predicted amidophosphoribosyltransferase